MCGIIAMISKLDSGFDYKTESIFTQMLYTNALRGFDSTGVFGINKHGNLELLKSATTAQDFINTKAYNAFQKKIFMDFRVVVGHNRASTKGAKTDENAHPFLEGNTCLVHNGTLQSHKHLKDVDVDSHAICHAFNEKDYKQVISEDLDGAFAIIWYNAKEKKLYITRNPQRPLWVIELSSMFVISSEPRMMEWILDRNGNKEKVVSKFFDTTMVYVWNMDKLSKGYSTEDLPEKKPILKTMVQEFNNKFISKPHIQNQTKNNTPIYKNYYYGDELIFEHDTNTIGETVLFTGVSLDANEIAVSASCSLEKENLTDLVTSDNIKGVIAGISWKNNVPKLILKFDELEPKKFYTSCTGIFLDEKDLLEHGNTCGSCKKEIDFEKENKKFWVRQDDTKIKVLKCQTCVSKNVYLNKYLGEDAYYGT